MPDEKSVEVRSGTTLLSAAKRAGVPIRTRCGGVAGCLMCKVKVLDPASVSPPSARELRKLGEDAEDRLSCQALVKSNTTVIVPEDPLKAAIRRRLEQQKEDGIGW